jgi:hypothetical protein
LSTQFGRRAKESKGEHKRVKESKGEIEEKRERIENRDETSNDID